MNKYVLSLSALILAGACSSAFAQDNGAFFVNAGVGRSQYHVGYTHRQGYTLDDKDTAGALRFGYAWHVADGLDLGVEAGYARLGKMVLDYRYAIDGGDYSLLETEHAEVKAKGWLLGTNGKYHFADGWYVSARAGWLIKPLDVTYSYGYIRSDGPDEIADIRSSGQGKGWYGGVGGGYDFSSHFGLGLTYDNYHASANIQGFGTEGNVGVFSLTAEYRF
jgi:hypothetical protein